MTKDSHKPSRWQTVIKVCLNLLIMAAIVLILGWLAMLWMDHFTLHGQTRTIPDLRGLDYNAAAARLEEDDLIIELSDSVYESKARPGAIIDQNPKGGNVVKPGRVVYVTINAFSPKMVTVPQLTDISVRQARSVLEGLGIKNVTEVSVVSEYAGLVLGASCDGHRLLPGARLPVTARVTLQVGDGMPDLPDTIMVDSIHTGAAEAVEKVNIE